MHNYRELKIWQSGISLSLEIYKLTKVFPKSELYGLTSQLNRAGVSVPSNIAEGTSRRTARGFVQFLDIALGSLYEVDTQLTIAHKLNYIDDSQFETINKNVIELQKMLNGFIKKIKNEAKGFNKFALLFLF